MNIKTTEFKKNSVNTYNKISFYGESFHAVYRLQADGSIKFSGESDESLVILNGYTLKEILFLNISELLKEIKRLAYWGLFLESKDELLLAYVALMENKNNATDYLMNREVTTNEHYDI